MGDTQSDLIPYRYQDEVFQRAKKENIIAALNTGSGKTLISILLIKWISSQDHAKGKAIVFLVPRVTLVDQQAETISKRTPLRVAKLFGAMEIDMNNRAGWKKKIENRDVFVMTPQIFLNLITHGLWSIQKVSLMIFDECHHARKNHPYNGILREYFQLEPSLRPKVFGMTASPVWNTKNPQISIAQLESNMNAKVVGIHENVSELEEKSPKPEERIQSYPFPPISYDCPLTGLFSCLALIDKSVWTQLAIPFYPTLENRYLSTLGNLGPYSASLFLYFEIQHLLHNLREEKHLDDMDDNYMGIINSNVNTSQESHEEEIKFILDILKDFKPFFPSNASSHDIPIPVNLDWCTPKVKVLVDLLVEFGTKFPAFQCVIFVEQRQVASTLSKLLQVIPELNPKIKTAFLVGQGTNSEGLLRSIDQFSGDPVKMFKDGVINVLVATSVAEEGLDFKACDLVIRFDGLHHMVSYVQSRGRARKKVSTFVVMVPEGQEDQLAKYLTMKNNEGHITNIYRTRNLDIDDNEEDDEADEGYSLDLGHRERYVVESTGAVLSYDNALNLLCLLCSQIPCDPFTPMHKPKFRGDFQATLYLPWALPLRPEHLVYYGPQRHSKKEAKRAVAFMAVKHLRELDVFDEYFLPISSKVVSEDETSSPSRNARSVPPMMSVLTRDPWCIGQRLWLHRVIIDGTAVAGLVTGTRLPPTEVVTQARRVAITCGEQLSFEETTEHDERRRLMEDFTKYCIFYNITASPLNSRLSLYLVPITPELHPDFPAMENLISNPRGCSDWSRVSEQDYDRLMVLCLPRFASVHLLHRIRSDLTPMSKPNAGSRESAFSTYHEYWQTSWTTKRRVPTIATEGPIIETRRAVRSNVGTYDLYPSDKEVKKPCTHPDDRLLPQANCGWVPLSQTIREAYGVLPTLCYRITHVCRAQYARVELGLPAIADNLLIEALTIPSAAFSFNNQRLETLGDAVLQVCTTVHLFHQYPNRHEGQLTRLRHDYVCNQFLLQRALDLGLERYIICETPAANKWRYLLSDEDNSAFDGAAVSTRYVLREFPRRSLQDCMEAIIGASFLAGGINMALQTGTSLGLGFGGPLPWFLRYPSHAETKPLPPLFAALEERLGYRFQRQDILREALTHPSSSLDGQWSPSYQRLEFLGDAILELVVTRYLYDKFPHATSHELSHPRSKAICSPTLAFLAVKRLGLHNMMLADSFTLNLAIANSVSILEDLSAEEIVKEGWRFEPPKALSDVFESVMGAVFIDSGCDYEKTATVMEHVMEDALEVLSPAIAQNPVSELLEWLAGQGCTKVRFEKSKKPNSEREGMLVTVHGIVIAGPIFSMSKSLSKFAVADRSLAVLRDPQSEKFVERLCTCRFAMQVDNQPESDATPSDIEDDEEVSAFLWPTDGATEMESE